MALGKKTGGRKKGTPNKQNSKTRDDLWRYIEEHGKTNPLEFMLDIVHDQSYAIELRVDCAKAVTPYMASKLQPVDPATGKAEQKVKVKVVLTGGDDGD